MSVQVLPPVFCRRRVEGWLLQLEAHFAYREITEDAAKYTIAVVTIDKDVIVELPKFEEPKFENLTRWLKNVYGLKQEDTFQRLLSDQTTEEDPGAFLRRLLAELPKDTHGSKITRVLFMNRLPQSVKSHLAALDPSTPLQTLADTADRILRQERPSTNAPATLVAAVPGPPDSTPASTVTAIPLPASNTPASAVTAVAMPTDSLSVFFDRFSKMMEGWDAKLTAVAAGHTTPRTRFRNRSPAPSRRRGECFYHHNFGRRARKCEPPCTYPSGNGEGGSFQ